VTPNQPFFVRPPLHNRGMCTDRSNEQIIHESGWLSCEWCKERFDRRSQSGRRPRFCKASHRVRACERRRGLIRPGAPPLRYSLPPAELQRQAIGVEGSASIPNRLVVAHYGQETGYSRRSLTQIGGLTFHRIRPGALPNKSGHVPSLCGTMITVVQIPTHAVRRDGACKRCEALAPLHPTDSAWWAAGTQRGATAILDAMRSSLLVVGQAMQHKRDPIATLNRVHHELTFVFSSIGLPPNEPASLHPRSLVA
jgi:hypothetical protein